MSQDASYCQYIGCVNMNIILTHIKLLLIIYIVLPFRDPSNNLVWGYFLGDFDEFFSKTIYEIRDEYSMVGSSKYVVY